MEKKGPFSWARRSRSSGKGSYAPVSPGQVEDGNMGMGEKRRSWFGGKMGSVMSEAGRSKKAERDRERESLAGANQQHGRLYG
jgi:hypothetical protein